MPSGRQTEHVPRVPHFFPFHMILPTEIIAISVISHVKRQFGNSSWCNNYGRQPEKVVHESVIDEFTRNLILNDKFCFVLYVTYEYNV